MSQENFIFLENFHFASFRTIADFITDARFEVVLNYGFSLND